MNSQTLHADQVDFSESIATSQRKGIFRSLIAIGRLFQDAQLIEQQAKHLYALSDSALAATGITREQVAPELVKLYRD